MSFFSIDVECVATGPRHDARAVAQIALVDIHDQPLLNLYVLPEEPVVSCLTPLTGITQELLLERGVPLDKALSTLRAALPKDATLVGQSIGTDVAWLGLREGVDFAGLIDLAGLFRTWNATYKSWSVFGQEHLGRVLLQDAGDGTEAHNALSDAVKSMRLFRHKSALTDEGWASAQQALLSTQPNLSFARRFPTYDGVCMGNRKTCACGAPFSYA
jgi:RNA exonuclease 4